MATREQLIEDFADHKLATGEKFERLINSMKAVQEPVADPAASGTSLSFIDSISQDADGKITATKKTLDLANAHELNPFKGWYKTGDTLPTDGFDGAYLYFKDTSELTGQTTIYRWNGTTYADTGTVVDTSNVQTFETGQALNGVAIDNSRLVNPAANALAKATNVMPLAAKLEGVTAVEDKLVVMDETTGLINFDNTTGSTSSYKWGKFDVQGYKRVRFNGYVRGNGYSNVGFCFVDAEDNWIDGYAYEFVTDNVPSVQKEYVVAVPKGAVYLKTNTVAGTNMPASDFYCYGLKGENVFDTINGWDDIEVGEELVSTLTVNSTRYLTLTHLSGTENVFYDEGGSRERIKILKLKSNWKQLRITTASRVIKVLFLKKEYNVRETITFDELKQGGYICDGITSYNELFKTALDRQCTHIAIPEDAKVAYFGIRQYQETADRTPQSIVPVIATNHQGVVEEALVSEGRCDVGLFLGQINPVSGGITSVLDDDRGAFKTFISNPYKLNGCKIKSIIGANSSETLTVYMYSDEFAYLGYMTNIAAVEQVKGCEYVLFGLTQDTAYAHSRRILSVAFSGSGKIEKSHWGKYRDDPYWITFEVERLCAVEPATAAYSGRTQRVYTTGYVILPPNYDRNGEPVPLAMFIHGTGGYTYGESSIAYYSELLKFVAKNGYAVVDCCTMGNIYSATTDLDGNQRAVYTDLDGNTKVGYKDVNYPCHLSVDCYVSLYKYATEMFNIDKDRVFVWGKSSGGRLATVLAQNKLLPIKAVGVLNGGLDTLTNFRVLGYDSLVAVKKLMEDDMGFTNIPSSFLVSDQPYRDPSAIPSALIDYLLANVDKIAGFNPLFTGVSNFDIDTYERAQFACSMAANDMRDSMLNNPTLMAQVNGGFKTSLVPTKIWAAEDDENVPYPMARIYTKLVKRGGGICELRTIPAGYGKHWAVDIAPNIPAGYGTVDSAPKTSYVTKFGEEIAEVTVTYAELVDWFNQW